MSDNKKKVDADNQTQNRLTRSAIQNDPTLKYQLVAPDETSAFSRSKKIIRSPPKQSTIRNTREIKNETVQNTVASTGTLPKKLIKNQLKINIKQAESLENKQESDLLGSSKSPQQYYTPFTPHVNIPESQYNASTLSLIEDLSLLDIEGINDQPSLLGSVNNNNQLAFNFDNKDIFNNILSNVSVEQINNRNNQNMALKLPLKDVVNLVPEFDGKNISAAEYVEKLKQAESITQDLDIPNLTKILKIKLRGQAYKALGNANINTIKDLIKAVRTLYPILDDIHILHGELSRILQGEKESVIDYTNRIKDLVLKIKELKASEGLENEDLATFNTSLDNEAAKSFKAGLKLEIKVELGAETTLENLSIAAIEIENNRNKRRGLQSSAINTTFSMNEEITAAPIKILSCQICRDHHHEALFCRSSACVYCKGSDHFSNNCRSVTNKIILICRFCNQPGHSISTCKFNRTQNNHCQYCQEMGHEVSQCPFIIDYEVCWKCKETGHNPNICPNNKQIKVELCEYCDSPGHKWQQCPEVICKKCNQKGHALKFCKVGEDRFPFRICTFCEEKGHEASECDQVKILVTQYKTKQQYKCQICEETGHTAKYCSNYKNLQQPQAYSRNNYNTNVNTQRKICEYCGASGHEVQECRKIEALKKHAQTRNQVECSFCKSKGHLVTSCSQLRAMENSLENFCTLCKGIGHTLSNCFRNTKNPRNNSGNEQASP